MKTIPEMIREGADLFEERAAIYGDSFRQHGHVMRGLFPNGVGIFTEDDQNRWGVMNMIVSKLVRYANNFASGGHDDSLADLAVYSQILRRLDLEATQPEEPQSLPERPLGFSSEPPVPEELQHHPSGEYAHKINTSGEAQ